MEASCNERQRPFLAFAFALWSGAALAALNLNTGTKEELIALPEIGPAKAQAILDYRNAHGGFKSVEERKDVKGIGARRFEKLKGELTVAGTPAKPGARPADKAGGAPQRSAKGEVSTAPKAGEQPAAKP
jgi:competence protein ComEA